MKHIDPFLGKRRIAALGPADFTAYAEARQAEGVSNATINRELGVIHRALTLAFKQGKLFRVPPAERLREAEPRQGFFEHDQYDAVRRNLPPDLGVAIAIGYTLGWRIRSEVLTLEYRKHVDLEKGTLTLDRERTKTKKPRLVFMPPDLTAEIAGQVERVKALERETEQVIPWLFPHLSDGLVSRKTRKARYRRGDRIRDFRRAWATACIKAGLFKVVRVDEKRTRKVPTMLRHDFRRTAVRNMVNDGTPERVAMQFTGHRTRSIFDRYHIVAPEDLKAAAARMAARNGAFGPTSGPTKGVVLAARRASKDNARTRL